VTTRTPEREAALAATELACPRCGARRAREQEYCVECGLRLPPLDGTVPALRRRWLRRFGWYPGDWLWTSLATLLVAIAGTVVAIAIVHGDRAAAGRTVVAPTLPGVGAQAPPVTTPVAPSHRPNRNGRLVWPAGRNGWTIVLVSYPKAGSRAPALRTSARAAKASLPQVGVLDSSLYPSLQPGYFVVFTGIYASQDLANAALATAQQAGFAGAYVRQIAR
jgi:hypothetical protein